MYELASNGALEEAKKQEEKERKEREEMEASLPPALQPKQKDSEWLQVREGYRSVRFCFLTMDAF